MENIKSVSNEQFLTAMGVLGQLPDTKLEPKIQKSNEDHRTHKSSTPTIGERRRATEKIDQFGTPVVTTQHCTKKKRDRKTLDVLTISFQNTAIHT